MRVIVLHARRTKADFAWATVTQAGLEIDHPALNEFTLSQSDRVNIKPYLTNEQLRNFQETKWMGHCVLLWTLCGWQDLSIDWINRTAVFMGGKAGHTNLFYGPMVISVLKQDIVARNDRTPDHVQMRTLRQIADYIQMVDDNPCVGNPSRFRSVPESMKPEPNLKPIPGVKINDHFELVVMGPLGMNSPREQVSVCVNSRKRGQGAAAVPFVLGLKWFARSAELDMVIETDKTKITAMVETDLVWAQWELRLLPVDPNSPIVGLRKAKPDFAHLHRSLVIIQAGGAPLRIEHIDALTRYLHSNQKSVKDRAAISKEGFAAFWQQTYGSTDIPSPYDLEASYPANLLEDDADVMSAFEAAAASEVTKKTVLHFNAVRGEALIKRLKSAYPDDDDQMKKVVNTLISHCLGEKSIEIMQDEALAENPISEDKLQAIGVVVHLANAHTSEELRDITRFLDLFTPEGYLNWFKGDDVQSNSGTELSEDAVPSNG